MGTTCCITIAKVKDLEEYKEILEGIINLVHREITTISNGGMSKWNLVHLERVILPEIEELHQYILKGQLLLKYGRDQRLLESTYMMTDWIIPVDYTPLGILIRKLQHKIESQE